METNVMRLLVSSSDLALVRRGFSPVGVIALLIRPPDQRLS
jgi:hypothetical protein